MKIVKSHPKNSNIKYKLKTNVQLDNMFTVKE